MVLFPILVRSDSVCGTTHGSLRPNARKLPDQPAVEQQQDPDDDRELNQDRSDIEH
jgi:hypothetical protein